MDSSLIDRQFNRAYISIHDMEKCIECLECAATAFSRDDFPTARGLLTAAVVNYARPFSNNTPHPRATSTPSFRLSLLSSEERDLHKHILDLRNEAIAHSDADRNPVKADLYNPTGWVASSRLYDPLSEADLIPTFTALAKKARGIFASATLRAASQASRVAP